MQPPLPRFIQNLGYTAASACTYACIPRDAHVSSRVYPCTSVSISTRFSLHRIRNGLSSLRRLASFSLPPATPAGVPSFLRVYYDPMLLSTYYYPEMHRKSLMHVYLPHVFVYLLDQFTLKVPFDESSCKCGEPRTQARPFHRQITFVSRVSR